MKYLNSKETTGMNGPLLGVGETASDCKLLDDIVWVVLAKDKLCAKASFPIITTSLSMLDLGLRGLLHEERTGVAFSKMAEVEAHDLVEVKRIILIFSNHVRPLHDWSH